VFHAAPPRSTHAATREHLVLSTATLLHRMPVGECCRQYQSHSPRRSS
jgi:hypothetical protein